ncbi:hypothetical protein [Paraburkholderia sp. SIMBA_030]|uniref:hypothetical protein n=1 Tax=Paraburkholderia sp. SIMBA_030 TaxID=3085773 RepID=UPI0039782241
MPHTREPDITKRATSAALTSPGAAEVIAVAVRHTFTRATREPLTLRAGTLCAMSACSLLTD